MKILFFIISCGLAASLSAQSPDQSARKIGFADPDFILSQLPEFKKIESDLKTHGSQLENELKAKYNEYQAKLKAYQSMPATTPDAIKADKEGELSALQQAIEKFKQDAQSSYQKKQADLLNPIQKKIGDAIEVVAKENGYSFITSLQVPNVGIILLYKDEKYNISDLVLKKLGVTPTASAPPKTN